MIFVSFKSLIRKWPNSLTISLVLCSNSLTKKMVLDRFIKWCVSVPAKKKKSNVVSEMFLL